MFNLKNIYKEVENFDGCFNSSFGGSGAAIQEDEKKKKKKNDQDSGYKSTFDSNDAMNAAVINSIFMTTIL